VRALHLSANLPTESHRIAAAVDGDLGAREWLARTWTPTVYRYCYRMMRNEPDARDATQDTLMKVLKALHRYDPKRSFKTWVLGIARNTCIDALRRGKRRSFEPPKDVPSTEDSPLRVLGRRQQAQTVREALDELKPMYREVLVLYHFEHLKYAEIAESLSLPIGTVMNRIFRARKQLRAVLEPGGIA